MKSILGLSFKFVSADSRLRGNDGLLKKSAGFSMVGALVAATIGAISILGLTQMSSNIVSNLSKSKKIHNMVTLSEEIRHSFQADRPNPCDHTTKDCFNACTSSLFGISATPGTDSNFAIRESSETGTGAEIYKGGETYKGLKIQEIKYVPWGSNYGIASVHFSLSEDTRETLTTPQSLHFAIFVNDNTGGSINECIVASTKIAGAGLSGIANSCRHVDGEPPDHPTGKKQTLLGCGGTEGNTASEAIAFGYKTAGDFDANSGAGVFSSGAGNTFFGYEVGKSNSSGKNNVFIGHQTGWKNTIGENNIFLGYQTGYKIGTDDTKGNTEGANNILIGRQVVLPDPLDENKLNIGNVIEGEDLKILTLSPLVYPKLTLKAPVEIDPKDIPPPESPTPEPGLFVLGKMEITQKTVPLALNPPKATIEAAGVDKDHPEMTLTADILNMQKKSNVGGTSGATAPFKVEGTAFDPELDIEADLEVRSRASSTTPGPGVTVFGHLTLKNRSGSARIEAHAHASPDQPRLRIVGAINVQGTGTGSTSNINDYLNVNENLAIPPSDTDTGTAEFKDLVVTNATFKENITIDILSHSIPTANIRDALMADPIVTIDNATLTSVNENSHTHPPHNHPYSPVGNHHPPCPASPACTGCAPCGCFGPPCPPPPPPPPPPSSRTIKRNIKPINDYEKSLKEILNTPLFTWQFKKDKGDHPEKVRMGIISEELPKDLQILDKGKPSTPDWPSIYGTFWAGIKALNQRLKDFKDKSMTKLTELSKELKTYFTDQTIQLKKELILQIGDLKTQLKNISQNIQKQAQDTNKTAKKFAELKKQFQEVILNLKNRQEELKKIRAELKNIQKQIKEVEGI